MAFRFRLAEAFVVLGVDRAAFKTGLARARRDLEQSLGKMDSAARVARRSLLIAGGAIAFFVKQASDAREIATKFEAVFREQAAAASRFGDELGEAVGRSTIELKEALSTFQGFFIGLGFGSKRAREMSQELTRLSVDFASFNNLADSEATQRFISALSGSAEVLDRFGINIKAAAIEQELLASGIEKSAQQASEQEKAIARLAIITRAMTQQGAVGDAVRTAGEFANQIRRLRGELKDTAVTIGSLFIPELREQVSKLGDLLPKIEAWVERSRFLIVENVKLAAKIAILVVILPRLARGILAVAAAFKTAGSAARSMAAGLGLAVTAVAEFKLAQLRAEVKQLEDDLRGATGATQAFAKAMRAMRDETADPAAVAAAATAGIEQIEAELNRRVVALEVAEAALERALTRRMQSGGRRARDPGLARTTDRAVEVAERDLALEQGAVERLTKAREALRGAERDAAAEAVSASEARERANATVLDELKAIVEAADAEAKAVLRSAKVQQILLDLAEARARVAAKEQRRQEKLADLEEDIASTQERIARRKRAISERDRFQPERLAVPELTRRLQLEIVRAQQPKKEDETLRVLREQLKEQQRTRKAAEETAENTEGTTVAVAGP